MMSMNKGNRMNYRDICNKLGLETLAGVDLSGATLNRADLREAINIPELPFDYPRGRPNFFLTESEANAY